MTVTDIQYGFYYKKKDMLSFWLVYSVFHSTEYLVWACAKQEDNISNIFVFCSFV